MKFSITVAFIIATLFGLVQISSSKSINLSKRAVDTSKYTKEVFTVTVTDVKNKLYTVNGSTATVDMQYFKASASGSYFNGQTSKEGSTVYKKFKNGKSEARARYILSGKDSNNQQATLFIEDNLIGYDSQKRPITKPIIITRSSKLSFLQTADIQGVIEEKGNGSRVIHIMWNESNKSRIPYPIVKMPDTSRNYNKEIFTFDINVGGGGFDNVSGADGAMAMMIGFTCSSNTNDFKAKGLDNFVDTRMQFQGQAQTLSAIYILEGKDGEGRNSRVYIENNGIDVNGINTEPIIITDNPKWAWIEKAPLHGDSTMTNGFKIHMYTVNDPSLWTNFQPDPEPQPEPEPEPEPEPQPTGQCPSKIINMGYSCCKATKCNVIVSDDDADWSVENNEWCACVSSVTCNQKVIDQGFPCCSTCSQVVYVDDAGNWGVENNDWCGLPTNC